MGVLAVYGVQDASTLLYYGLHNLQHRGQEGGGIATFDENGKSFRYRGLGLLNEIFTNGEVAKLKGNLGIGSVKYANASKEGLDNVQPVFFHHRSGDFAVASDGNLVNSRQIKDYLEKLLYCAQKYDADIVQCDFTKDPQTLGQPTAPGQKAITLIYDEDILRDYLRLGVPKVFACGKLYKSGLFQDVRYPFGLIDEDNYTTFKLMYGIHVFININRQMYYYRTNMESITNMAFSERKFGILKSPDAIREFLKDKTTEYNDDVDYYDMRQNIQLYNNAVQANAEDQFAVQLKPVYDKLMNYKDKHIGIDLKYRMMLQLLKQSKPLYKKMIQTLR